jgi:hypothetical protein
MKLKIAFLTLFFASTVGAAFSQARTNDEMEAIVTLLGMDKKKAVAQLVNVTPKDSVAFWNVYQAFEDEQRKFRKQRINIAENTAKAYENMDAKTSDGIVKEVVEFRIAQEKLLDQYYSKMKAATNPLLAFQFYQSEIYLITLARATIMEQIPTYGQLLKAKQ